MTDEQRPPVYAGKIDLDDPVNQHMASQFGHRIPPRLRLTTKLQEREVQRLSSVVDIGLDCYAHLPRHRFIKRHNSAHRIVQDLLRLYEAEAELRALIEEPNH